MAPKLAISYKIVGQKSVGEGWTVDLLQDGEILYRNLPIKDPLGPENKAICRWYLQQYAQLSPFSVDKAAKAGALLEEYPRKLLRQLPLGQAVLSHVEASDHDLTSIVVSIDIHQKDTANQDGPEVNIHQLFWETLESKELWYHPNLRVVIRRCLRNESVDSAHELKEYRPLIQVDDPMTINILLVVARDLTSNPLVYDDVSPSIATNALLKLRDRLNKQTGRTKLCIEIVRPGTFEAFKEHLRKTDHARGPGHYHIVHFDMHGRVGLRKGKASKYAMLYFAKADSFETTPTPGIRVSKILKEHRVPFAVLNACESARATDGDDANIAKLFLEHGLQGVIGMSFKISSSSVAIFLDRFYWALLFQGSSFAMSAAAGRDALRLNPKRPARYGSERSLNDSFVAVTYENDQKPSLSFQRVQSMSGEGLTVAFEPDATCYYQSHWNHAKSDSNNQEEPQGSALSQETKTLLSSNNIRLLGRDFELLRLEKRITENNLLYLSGLAGVGKTLFVKHALSTWKSTNFVHFTVYMDFGTTALKTADDIMEEILRQISSQSRDHQLLTCLWSMSSRPLLSYDTDRLRQIVLAFLAKFNVAVVLEGLEPIPLPLAWEDDSMEEISPTIKWLLCLAQDRQRATRLYVIITSRRISPQPLETQLDHEIKPYCYDLGGLGLPDGIELSKIILREAGEPVERWMSEDADWLESVISLAQGIPSVLFDILPLQQSRGIPWRQFFGRLHQGLITSLTELREDGLENCAVSREIRWTLFPKSHSMIMCLISMFWHEAVPMDQLIKIFLEIADEPLKNEFRQRREGDAAFWAQLFYGFVADRGYIREDHRRVLQVHPIFSIIVRAHLYHDYVNLSNRVKLKISIGTSLEASFFHPVTRSELFPINVLNLLTTFNFCLSEVPASRWPLAIICSSTIMSFNDLPSALKTHMMEMQLRFLDEIPFKLPLLQRVVGHIHLYALTLFSLCCGERYRDNATWKRILNLSGMGHNLMTLLNPDDETELVALSRGFLLAATTISAYELGQLEEAHTNWKSLQLLKGELLLPTVPLLDHHSAIYNLKAIEEFFETKIKPSSSNTGMEDLSWFKLVLATVIEEVGVEMKKWEQGTLSSNGMPNREAELEKKVANLMQAEDLELMPLPGTDSRSEISELILFNYDNLPSPPTIEADARLKLADLQKIYDAGEWMDVCETHMTMASKALIIDQFQEAQSHLASFYDVAATSPASPSLLRSLRDCQGRLMKANLLYQCHVSIYPPRFFDRGSGFGFARRLDRSMHLGSIDEGFWSAQALLWPWKDCKIGTSSISKWWEWWGWLLDSQGQDKRWVTHVRASLGLYLRHARLMDSIFISSGHNDFEKALSLLDELQADCEDSFFAQIPTSNSPLQSIRDCFELALEQFLVFERLATWDHSLGRFPEFFALIDKLACLRPLFCSWFPNKSIEGFRYAAERLELLDYQIRLRDMDWSTKLKELQELHQELVSRINGKSFDRLDAKDVLTVRSWSLKMILSLSIKYREWEVGMKCCDEYLELSGDSYVDHLRSQDSWNSARKHCEWERVCERLEKAEDELDFDKCLDLLQDQEKTIDSQNESRFVFSSNFISVGPRLLAFKRQIYVDYCHDCVHWLKEVSRQQHFGMRIPKIEVLRARHYLARRAVPSMSHVLRSRKVEKVKPRVAGVGCVIRSRSYPFDHHERNRLRQSGFPMQYEHTCRKGHDREQFRRPFGCQCHCTGGYCFFD